MWPKLFKAYRQEVHRLGDLLGDDHDLAVLRRTICERSEAVGAPKDVSALGALLDRRRQSLQQQARPLLERVYCEKPGRFADRIRCYWHSRFGGNW